MSSDAETSHEWESARHAVAHRLSSPVRGTAIVADLLAEELETPEPDLQVIRELSGQLITLVEETTDRLSAFASGDA